MQKGKSWLGGIFPSGFSSIKYGGDEQGLERKEFWIVAQMDFMLFLVFKQNSELRGFAIYRYVDIERGSYKTFSVMREQYKIWLT